MKKNILIKFSPSQFTNKRCIKCLILKDVKHFKLEDNSIEEFCQSCRLIFTEEELFLFEEKFNYDDFYRKYPWESASPFRNMLVPINLMDMNEDELNNHLQREEALEKVWEDYLQKLEYNIEIKR